MSSMLTRTWRTADEVADQRALVAAQLAMAGARSEYTRVLADAVERTFGWVFDGGPAPISGTAAAGPVDDGAVVAELALAVQSERAAVGGRGERDPRWLGLVGVTLAWLRCERGARPPV